MLKVEYVNPFIENLIEVLKQYGIQDIKRGRLGVEKGKFNSKGV